MAIQIYNLQQRQKWLVLMFHTITILAIQWIMVDAIWYYHFTKSSIFCTLILMKNTTFFLAAALLLPQDHHNSSGRVRCHSHLFYCIRYGKPGWWVGDRPWTLGRGCCSMVVFLGKNLNTTVVFSYFQKILPFDSSKL